MVQDITLVGKDPSFEPVITFSINNSTIVTSVSESLKQDTYNHFDIKNGIEVVPNFICSKEYQLPNNEKYRKRYAPNGEKIITHVSNFRKVKRVQDAIKTFAEVRKQIPAKMLFVGDGPERNMMSHLCREYGVCGDILFLGSLKSTKEVLNISDLFILPSEKESFGLSALEAMAAGVPVVASNTGGIPEVVEHGKSGLLGNVGDIETMVSNTLEILSDDNTLAEYKKHARERASEFDIIKILPIYEELYERALTLI